jgi:transposase
MASKGFIRYEIRNGVEYASHCVARRVGASKVNDSVYLGRVIDKAQEIYKNRERGVFSYTIDDGFNDAPSGFAVEILKERMILDFGDAFLVHHVLVSSGMLELLGDVFTKHTDTLCSLLMYRMIGGASASRHAETWWEGTWARELYPNANLASQRISEFLCEIGTEEALRMFFAGYLKLVGVGTHGVLIDSTGLPNDAHFGLTAINTHNGVTSNEARLVLVVDRHTSAPLYFRYVAGNIVDVSTLKTTLSELEAMGVSVDWAIVDAGYYSEGNIRQMQEDEIPFLVRMVSNRKLYKDLVKEYAYDLEDAVNMVRYRDRILYIKRVTIDLFGKEAYAYIACDIDRKHDEVRKYARGALEDGTASDEMNEAMRTKGLFILLSSAQIDVKEILPLYYTRQAVEQVFDISKNLGDLMPLRIHSEEAFRGHLLLSFIATAILLRLNGLLDGTNECAEGALLLMRNLKCKVFNNMTVVQEPNKRMNDIAEKLKFKFPVQIAQ